MATILPRAICEADFALDLRPADTAECIAGGMSSAVAIHVSLLNSQESYAIEADGEVVAFWGYGTATILGTAAYGWLLTRPGIEKHKFRFIRSSQRIVEHILETYLSLLVLVHYEHTEAKRWLLWLGFKQLPYNGFEPEGFTYFGKGR